MDPKTNVEYLDYLQSQLKEFIKAFDEFMTMHVENTGPNTVVRGMMPAVFAS